jgi:hypothetical protein
MENNPYKSDYHNYLENLKLSLDKSNSYIKSNPNPVYTEEEKPKVNFLKYGISAIAIIVIGISLISFLTQGVLLVFDKNNKEDQIINIVKTDQDQVNDQLKNFYVRADLNRDIFATTTDEVATSTPATTTVAAVEEDISKYFNVNIPGVSRIGYDESLGNQFLTDNINKVKPLKTQQHVWTGKNQLDSVSALFVLRCSYLVRGAAGTGLDQRSDKKQKNPF